MPTLTRACVTHLREQALQLGHRTLDTGAAEATTMQQAVRLVSGEEQATLPGGVTVTGVPGIPELVQSLEQAHQGGNTAGAHGRCRG
jgi:hypothetical protein